MPDFELIVNWDAMNCSAVVENVQCPQFKWDRCGTEVCRRSHQICTPTLILVLVILALGHEYFCEPESPSGAQHFIFERRTRKVSDPGHLGAWILMELKTRQPRVYWKLRPIYVSLNEIVGQLVIFCIKFNSWSIISVTLLQIQAAESTAQYKWWLCGRTLTIKISAEVSKI